MRKGIKIVVSTVACVLIGAGVWLVNGLVGNPISKMIAERVAKQYIIEQYPNMKLQVSEVFYNFKDGCYHARIESPTSRDTYFGVALSSTGKVHWDSYESSVLERWNTYQRLSSNYRSKVELVLESEQFPYKSDIAFGDLKIKEEIVEGDFKPIYGLDIEKLELDKDYDLNELGKIAGEIVFYAEDEQVTTKRAAEILIDIKNAFDEEKIPFYAIDFVLEKPREEGGNRNTEYGVRVDDFLYSDLYEEGLEQRIEQAAKELEAYYKEQDAQKEVELSTK